MTLAITDLQHEQPQDTDTDDMPPLNHGFIMEHRAPKTELSEESLKQMYTEEYVDYLKEGLVVGDVVYLKGSTNATTTGGRLGPTDAQGNRHLQRSSDIDMYSQNPEVHARLLTAATKYTGGYRNTQENYTGTSKFQLDNGVTVDLNDGVKTALALQQVIKDFITTVEGMDSVGIDEPNITPTKSYLLREFRRLLADGNITPFDPKYLLSNNGFMPLESIVTQVKKNKYGDLEATVIDPYQIISRSQITEQAFRQSVQGKALGHVFPEHVLEYSPFYFALFLEFAREKDEKVYIENKALCFDIYANLLKMAREHVEGHIDIADREVLLRYKNKDPREIPQPALGPGSPIPYAATSLGLEDLVIRPKDEKDYKEVLHKLQKRAQLEFARSAASDTKEAILTFFVHYPFGGLIYPDFSKKHYVQNENKLEAEKLDEFGRRNHYFLERLAQIQHEFYPAHSVTAISTINPFEREQVEFMADKTAGSISEVMAMVLAADGYNVDTCEEAINELMGHWQPDQVLTDGWFYGDNETFDASLNREEILEHVKRFEHIAAYPFKDVQ